MRGRVPTPLESYLAKIEQIRALGAATPETSYYEALQNLLNDLGKKLKPSVFCLSNLKDQGAGFPDFWLYSQNQLRRRASLRDPVPDQLPERGVIEAKPPSEDVGVVAQSQQVADYWQLYGLVLVTNYRDFLLIGRDQFGHRLNLEHFTLADSPEEFWKLTAAPGKKLAPLALRFEEFLKRVLLHNAPLTQPKDVAWFLASYARDALARIEAAGTIPALDLVRTALEEALGMTFEGEKGRHFFHSTLVQTLFYGLFSAWVLWCKQNPEPEARKGFDHRSAHWHLRLPVLRALFEQVNTPGKLGPLRLDELMDWAALTLRRVDDRAFFSRFQEDYAVQYFYEPFLEAFDPTLRKALGVRYTPPEVVEYMVERVDSALRNELRVSDGLADRNVYVLDPCCGTGSYLVAVLKRIERTLKENGDDALISMEVKRAALERVFGFEILPASFVVAHLQLSLLLDSLGALPEKRLYASEEEYERPAVYLTNALTGWEAPKGQQKYAPLPDVTDEIRLAGKVKRETPILVVLGNPPYNAFAGVSPREEQGSVEIYKEGLISIWGIKKFNLDDLYVRFFRMAERRIAEMTGRGIICYISNFSYLSDPSFVVMRQRFLSDFDLLWFDCMNGDSRETGKLTPEGKPDPSVFSTEQNRAGIRVGTAISLMVRKENRDAKPTIRYRDFWGVGKREELAKSLGSSDFDSQYKITEPESQNYFSFRPTSVDATYMEFPRLVDLSAIPPITGYKENRGFSLIDVDRPALESRMKDYFDSNISWEKLAVHSTGLTKSAARFDAPSTRTKVQKEERFDSARLNRYLLRPFELRWCYYCAVRPLWNEPRPSLFQHHFKGNTYFVSRPAGVSRPEGIPFYFTPNLCDFDSIRGHSYNFPIRLRVDKHKNMLNHASKHQLFKISEEESFRTVANLSVPARRYLKEVGLGNPDRDSNIATLVWLHALAIGYSVNYLVQNADGIRQNWARIPLPASKGVLLESAALGEKIAALLDTENPVQEVTAGAVRKELRSIAPISRVGGGSLNKKDLRVTARWGYAGQNRVTMPGPGDTMRREYADDERKAIRDGAAALGLTADEALACLGLTTYDIYLNDLAYWRNVPERVWRYTIGGYQVIKKWLSYREYELLGRPMSADEAREVMNMARRIAAILLMGPALDANYRAVCENTWPWPGRTSVAD